MRRLLCCVVFCVAAVIAANTVSLDAVRRYEARVRRLAKCLGVLPGMAVMGMMIPALLYIGFISAAQKVLLG
eukprot:COSAG05_NODE_240_length_13119_cov_122.275806_9_plen_72_part_00